MTLAASLVVVGVMLALLLALIQARNARSAEQASRPRVLADAVLVYREKMFRIESPIRLVAKVDRVYRKPSGTLVLEELKTRSQDRPYLTDVIQLSAQRLAIEIQTGAVVEPYAFVTVLMPNRKVRSHRVRLLDAAAVVGIYSRREAILAARALPTYVSSVSACRGCALRSKCDRFADPT